MTDKDCIKCFKSKPLKEAMQCFKEIVDFMYTNTQVLRDLKTIKKGEE